MFFLNINCRTMFRFSIVCSCSILFSFFSSIGILPKSLANISIINPCYALGLGSSSLHSYLNEVLDLDIELIDAEIHTIDNIVANLASAEAFKKADMQRAFFLSRLKFDAKRVGRRSFIHVSSLDAIKQPYLDFLVELNWPGSHLVRRYTILLDPAPITEGRRNERTFSRDKLNTIEKADLTQNTTDKATDKGSMEKLFGPEDKIQAPITPPVSDTTRTQPVSISGTIVTEVANTPVAQVLKNKMNEPKAVNRNLSNSKNARQQRQNQNIATQLVEITQINQTNQTQTNPADHSLQLKPHALNTAHTRLPIWLFWLSAFALLGIVSVTIWIINKYRLAKPRSKQRTHSKYLAAIEHQSSHFSSRMQKSDAYQSGVLEKKITESHFNLKEELELKLTLANQYIEVKDKSAAKELLDEIMQRGNDQQKSESENLLLKLSTYE